MNLKRSMLYISVFFFSVCSLALVSEDRGSARQQGKQEIHKPAHDVEVVVTNVCVYVNDRNGNRVTGLKKENFEVYEDGMLQMLTNFYEMKGLDVFAPQQEVRENKTVSSPPPVQVQSPQFENKIIFYVDNWQLHPLNRNQIIKKLETFIRNNFTNENPGNQGMVVCLGQKLEVLQKFTSDPRLLISAINETKNHSGQSLLQLKEKEDMQKELNKMVSGVSMSDHKYESFQRAMAFVKNYVESEHNDLIYSLKSLTALVGHMVGLNGNKCLIYISDGLAMNPGEVVFDYIDSVFPVGNARAEAMIYDATSLFKELTAKCNAAEVTLYPINSRGLDSRILSADRDEGWNVYTRGSGMVRGASWMKNEALKFMAEETGGLCIIDKKNIAPELERIGNDMQCYYSLGYRSLQSEDGRYHSLEVKLVGVEEDYDVRVRQGHVRISYEDRIRDSVSSRLFLHRQENPLDVRIEVLPVESLPASSRLCLKIKILIPIKNLILYNQGDTYLGKIKAYITLKDSQNRFSSCHELVEEIKIPASDYATAQKCTYPYVAEMYIESEEYIVSLCVRDMSGEGISYLQFLKKVE